MADNSQFSIAIEEKAVSTSPVVQSTTTPSTDYTHLEQPFYAEGIPLGIPPPPPPPPPTHRSTGQPIHVAYLHWRKTSVYMYI